MRPTGRLAHRPLVRALAELGPAAGRVRLHLLRRRPARAHDGLSGRVADPRGRHRDARRLDRRRGRPGALGRLPPIAGPRARRAGAAAGDGHAEVLARARSDLQGADRRAGRGDRHLRLLRVPAAPDSRHRSSTTRPRSRWARTSCRTSSSPARSCAASTTCSAKRWRDLPRAPGGAHRGAHPARDRQPQDVQELRQRDRARAPTRTRSATWWGG